MKIVEKVMSVADAQALLKKKDRNFDTKPYLDVLNGIKGDSAKVFEMTPDENESIRGLKLNLSRVANEQNVAITYGETPEKTLIVWAKDSEEAPKRRRGKKAAEVTTA